MTTLTCTIRFADGSECGKPAVATVKGRNGEVFAECIDHAPAHVVEARKIAMARSVTLTHPVTHRKVRTTSHRSFFVVVDHGNPEGHPWVALRTDNLETARKARARKGAGTVAVIFNLAGEVVV
jgi:hypothetical protein